MFSLAHACLCLKCVMGSQRRDVVVVVVEEEKGEEAKSAVHKEKVCVCAEGDAAATFLLTDRTHFNNIHRYEANSLGVSS